MVRLSRDARGDELSFSKLTHRSSQKTRVRTVTLSLLVACSLLWCLLLRPDSVEEPTEDGQLDLQPTVAPAVYPAWLAEADARLLLGLEDCDGACRSKEEVDESDKMRSAVLMLPNGQLENSNQPRLKDGERGWMVLYLFIIVYMFAALAVVCDEFFVPALEAFVDEFGISMDVAGATFMAAGGSMPELFTSFISTFQVNPEVGLAAIVGSAVFNVLFVIAVCAIFSSEVMTLSWWPLARDCFFYIIALITVAIVFGTTSPGEIQLWEAVVLLLEYICYCSFMKINGRCQDFAMSIFEDKSSRVTPLVTVQNPGTGDEGADVAAVGAAAPGGDGEGSVPISMTGSGAASSYEGRHEGRAGTTSSKASTGNQRINTPGMFRKGIVQLLTQNSFLYETAGIGAVVQIAGTLEETFKELDLDGDGFLSAHEIKQLLEQMGCRHNEAAVETALRRITRSSDGQVSFEAFKKWYIASEARIEIEVRRVFDHFDRDHSNTIDRSEIKEVMKSLGHKPTDEDIISLMEEISSKHDLVQKTATETSTATTGTSVQVCRVEEADASAECEGEEEDVKQGSDCGKGPTESITFEQFEAWYTQSLFCQKQKKQHQAEESAEDGAISLDPPEGGNFKALFWYVFTYPIVALLFCTLPDVRKEKFQRNYKIAILEFALSLVWIGIFSNLLYECTVVVSNTLRIPTSVSAITVLAAGTSIPDLLSSYIVARNGEGDMAVSSSIGSNIFDVTVGLPLPWLCYNLAYGKTVRVQDDELLFSVLLLVGMLIAVIGTIVLMKWRMTKRMGYVMLALYAVYVAQFLCTKLPTGDPLVSIPF